MQCLPFRRKIAGTDADTFRKAERSEDPDIHRDILPRFFPSATCRNGLVSLANKLPFNERL
jgi:hypothetical protein